MFIIQVAIAALSALQVCASDAFKSMEAICLENNFVSEHYTVTTSDDYILSLYRIPGSVTEEKNAVIKPAVLMMHGQDSDMM